MASAMRTPCYLRELATSRAWIMCLLSGARPRGTRSYVLFSRISSPGFFPTMDFKLVGCRGFVMKTPPGVKNLEKVLFFLCHAQMEEGVARLQHHSDAGEQAVPRRRSASSTPLNAPTLSRALPDGNR